MMVPLAILSALNFLWGALCITLWLVPWLGLLHAIMGVVLLYCCRRL